MTPSTLFANGLPIFGITDEQHKIFAQFAKDTIKVKVQVCCMWAIVNGCDDLMFEGNACEKKIFPKDVLKDWYSNFKEKDLIDVVFPHIVSLFSKDSKGGAKVSQYFTNTDEKIEESKSIIDYFDNSKEFFAIMDKNGAKAYRSAHNIIFKVTSTHFNISRMFGITFINSVYNAVSSWIECYTEAAKKKKEISDTVAKIFKNSDAKDAFILLVNKCINDKLISPNRMGFKFFTCFSRIKESAQSHTIMISEDNKLVPEQYSIGNKEKHETLSKFVLANPKTQVALQTVLDYIAKLNDKENIKEETEVAQHKVNDIVMNYYKYQGYAKLNINPKFYFSNLTLGFADNNYLCADISLHENSHIKLSFNIGDSISCNLNASTNKTIKRNRVFRNFKPKKFKNSITLNSLQSCYNGGYVIEYSSNKKECYPFYFQSVTIRIKYDSDSLIAQDSRLCFGGSSLSNYGYSFYDDNIHNGAANLYKDKQITRDVAPELINRFKEQAKILFNEPKFKKENHKYVKISLDKGKKIVICEPSKLEESLNHFGDINDLAYVIQNLKSAFGSTKINYDQMNLAIKNIGGLRVAAFDLGSTPTWHFNTYHIEKVDERPNYNLKDIKRESVSSNNFRNHNVIRFFKSIIQDIETILEINNYLAHLVYGRKDSSKFVLDTIKQALKGNFETFKTTFIGKEEELLLDFKHWLNQKTNNTVYGKMVYDMSVNYNRIKSLKSKPDWILQPNENDYWNNIQSNFNVSKDDIRNANYDAQYFWLIVIKKYLSAFKSLGGIKKPFYDETVNYYNNLKKDTMQKEANHIMKLLQEQNISFAILGESNTTIRDEDNEFSDIIGIPTRNKVINYMLIKHGITVMSVNEFRSSQTIPELNVQGYRDQKNKKNVYFYDGKEKIANSEDIASDNLMLAFLYQHTLIKCLKARPISDNIAIVNEPNKSSLGFFKWLKPDLKQLLEERPSEAVALQKFGNLWKVVPFNNEIEKAKNAFEKLTKKKTQTSTYGKLITFYRHGNDFITESFRNKEVMENFYQSKVLVNQANT